MLGQKLGPYNIIEEIGKGGMATVFRAEQPSVNRDVAIKLIRKNISDNPDAIQRFQREARLIARLEHIHILPVYDFDGSHDPPYIVMRYLEGGTLKEIMKQGVLPLPEVAYLFRQVCAAVDYAHRQGIMHRDLKPSNVMVDREGNTFVTDFGIARIASGDSNEKQITETGAIVGTPDYMSPEQAQGIDDIDHRTDVYSLGVMLFEMITGHLPYENPSSMGVLVMHMNNPIPSPLEINPDLPDAMETVIFRALAKDRDDRYANAAELADAMTQAIGGSVSLRPSRLQEAAGTSIMRRIGKVEDESGTGSSGTPSEQNKTVTALCANAAEYSLLVGEIAGSEPARRALEALWKAYERIVNEQEGQIFAQTDTEMLALWGADSTHEDDAERAVRTALHMRNTIQELGAAFLADDDDPLPLNIGINSGMALLIPAGDTGSLSASGTTISIANRLMQNAYGTILITHDTFRQVMGVFDISEDVPLRVRGRKEAVDTYRVEAEKARSFKIQLRGIEGVETQLIGRRAELEHLQKAYLDAVEDEETQVVTIISEPGLGKSRLLHEFDKWSELRPEKYRIFLGRATSSMRDRPYALIRDIVSFRFDILDSDNSDTIQQKLEAGIEDLLERSDTEMAHMIGQLSGFDLSESRHIKGLISDPQQLTNRAKQLFIRFFEQLAGGIQPVLMELEDIHHADDASLDLLNELFVANDELQLIVINNARPSLFDRRPEWGSGQPFHTQLELKPLDKRDSRDLVRELLQLVDDVPKALRDLLVDRAEGNPFYMEELVKMLLDDRVILRESDNNWHVEESRLGSLNVPTTLNGLLEARLDTLLAPEKLTLQRASVIGRIFYDSALEMMDAADETHLRDLDKLLDSLAEREFIHRRETTAFEGSTEYIFASNMLRDAIENALLERQIKTYNKAAGDWLVDIAGNRVDEYLSQIADYYEAAGEGEIAAQYLLRSSEKALNIGAYTDAQDAVKRAIELLPDNTRDFVRAELYLTEILARTANQTDAEQHGQRALELVRHLHNDSLQAHALYLLGEIATNSGIWDKALAHLDAALPIARAGNDRTILAKVLHGIGNTHFRLNDFDKARPFVEESLDIARDIGDVTLELIALNRLGTLFRTANTTESIDEAQVYLQECMTLAQKVGNREWEAAALVNMGVAATARAMLDPTNLQYYTQESAQYTEASARINREIGALQGLFISLVNLAENYMELDELEKAYPKLVEAIQVARQLGSDYWQLACVSTLARLHIYEGNIDTALETLGTYHYHTISVESGAEQSAQVLQLLPDTLPEKEIEEKMLKGKEHDYNEVLDAFLKEQGAL